jgi:tRNA(Ile)-lysidine synthase
MTGSPGKSKVETLEARVRDYIRRYNLSPGQGKLVVGVSGGPDSVCLLSLLNQLKAELGLTLHAAHLNHMLRGHDSDADAVYVTELCADIGVPVTVERRDVSAHQKEQRCSLEEAARNVRYTFLHEVAVSQGADRVAVAHTADDQAETILLHLVRGSGLKGLRGMQPLSFWKTDSGEKLTVVRPLLEVRHSETEAYCQKHRLSPRYDISNMSPLYLRNRMRQELLPLLEKYNPSINEALLRTSRLLDDDYSFIEELAQPLWAEVARWEQANLVLNSTKFRSLHLTLQRYLLRRALEEFLGTLRDIETVHIEQMRTALSSRRQAGKTFSLPGGLMLTLDYGKATLSYNPEALCPLPVLDGLHVIKLSGDTVLPGWLIKAREIPKKDASLKQMTRWQACFDLDKLGATLEVRGRRQGDRFQPLGLEQPQKLQDFMVNVKMSRIWRDRVPLVISGKDIIWVAGWRIAEPVKVTPQTKRVLCLEFEQTKST